jgi:hypothetical protein
MSLNSFFLGYIESAVYGAVGQKHRIMAVIEGTM